MLNILSNGSWVLSRLMMNTAKCHGTIYNNGDTMVIFARILCTYHYTSRYFIIFCPITKLALAIFNHDKWYNLSIIIG